MREETSGALPAQCRYLQNVHLPASEGRLEKWVARRLQQHLDDRTPSRHLHVEAEDALLVEGEHPLGIECRHAIRWKKEVGRTCPVSQQPLKNRVLQDVQVLEAGDLCPRLFAKLGNADSTDGCATTVALHQEELGSAIRLALVEGAWTNKLVSMRRVRVRRIASEHP